MKDAISTSIKVSVDGVELTEGWVYNEISNVVFLKDRTLITGDQLLQITYDYIEDCVE